MLFVSIYICACILIMSFAIWACWYDGDDMNAADLLKIVIMSFTPIMNAILFGICFDEIMKDKVIIRGRKK